MYVSSSSAGWLARYRAPRVNTLDLDIVYARDAENFERLLRALKSVSARFRDDASHIEPNESHLLSKRHKLLTTIHGHLDVLGTIEEDSGYESSSTASPSRASSS